MMTATVGDRLEFTLQIVEGKKDITPDVEGGLQVFRYRPTMKAGRMTDPADWIFGVYRGAEKIDEIIDYLGVFRVVFPGEDTADEKPRGSFEGALRDLI